MKEIRAQERAEYVQNRIYNNKVKRLDRRYKDKHFSGIKTKEFAAKSQYCDVEC